VGATITPLGRMVFRGETRTYEECLAGRHAVACAPALKAGAEGVRFAGWATLDLQSRAGAGEETGNCLTEPRMDRISAGDVDWLF